MTILPMQKKSGINAISKCYFKKVPLTAHFYKAKGILGVSIPFLQKSGGRWESFRRRTGTPIRPTRLGQIGSTRVEPI